MFSRVTSSTCDRAPAVRILLVGNTGTLLDDMARVSALSKHHLDVERRLEHTSRPLQLLWMHSDAKNDNLQHCTGTGKTSLAHLIVHGTPLRSARPTVGFSTFITTVGGPEDAGSLGSQRQTFVELWDIGMHARDRLARHMPDSMGLWAYACALKAVQV